MGWFTSTILPAQQDAGAALSAARLANTTTCAVMPPGGVETPLPRPRSASLRAKGATISPASASRAHAFLRSRAFVTPDDVKAIAPDVLRHRVLTTYEAEAEEVTSDEIVKRVLAKVEAP